MKNFEEVVLQSSIPVLVDFWGYDCAPCEALKVILPMIEKKFINKIKVVEINVNENPELAFRYSIKALPTLIMFKNGQVSNQFNKVNTPNNIIKFIEKEVYMMNTQEQKKVKQEYKNYLIERSKISDKLRDDLTEFCIKQGGHWFTDWQRNLILSANYATIQTHDRICWYCKYSESKIGK